MQFSTCSDEEQGILTLCSSRSRSTSPGSSSLVRCTGLASPSSSLPSSTTAALAQPLKGSNLVEADEGAFRSLYSVRNTFIDVSPDGLVHRDGCMHERDFLSCPAERIGMMTLPRLSAGFEGFDTAAEAAAAAVAMTLAAAPAQQQEELTVLGSPEMPTAGSREHAIGNCKPCAFYHKQGCQNGIQCVFCHLCVPGEKKRRQKEKKTHLRQMAQQQQEEEQQQQQQQQEQTTQKSDVEFASSQAESGTMSVPYVAYNVKNTFVQMSLDVSMPPLEREILSCPASKVGCMILPRPAALDMIESDALEAVPPPTWPATPLDNWPSTPAGDNAGYSDNVRCYYDYSVPLADAVFVPADMILPTSAVDIPTWVWQASTVPPPPPTSPPKSSVQTCESLERELALASVTRVAPATAPAKSASVQLRLADSIPGPEVVGSAEIPTVGSVSHRFGTCKPCAFLYKQGCENGVNCPFCHLCDPGEKKRRQKIKKAQVRDMKLESTVSASFGEEQNNIYQ